MTEKKYNRAMFFYYNFETILLSVLSVMWGLWIGFPLSPLYVIAIQALKVNFVPLAFVGLAFFCAGGFKLYGVFKHKKKWIEYGGMLGAIAWLWIFFLQLTVGYVAPGTIVYPFIAIWNGWLYLKARLYAESDFEVTLSQD